MLNLLRRVSSEARWPLVLLLLSIPTLLVAQSEQDAPFFKPDYTKKIMEGKTVVPGRDRAPSPQTTPSRDKAQASISHESEENPGFESTPDDSPVPSSDTSPIASPTPDHRDDLAATPIRQLGAILSAENHKHFEDNLRQLNEVALKFKIPLGKVYSIGMAEDLPDSAVLFAGVLQGAYFVGLVEPPAKYAVKKSPSWIIQTAEGEILLEGFQQLERFINSKGQFVANTGIVPGQARQH